MSKLAEMRKNSLLSQNDLVRISGVSRSLITKYECGEKDINKAAGETLCKIATALNCKIEDLLENIEEIKENVLFNYYKEWRQSIEEANKTQEEMSASYIICGSIDCGEVSVREDFSNYVGLEQEITFEQMLELEKMY